MSKSVGGDDDEEDEEDEERFSRRLDWKSLEEIQKRGKHEFMRSPLLLCCFPVAKGPGRKRTIVEFSEIAAAASCFFPKQGARAFSDFESPSSPEWPGGSRGSPAKCQPQNNARQNRCGPLPSPKIDSLPLGRVEGAKFADHRETTLPVSLAQRLT